MARLNKWDKAKSAPVRVLYPPINMRLLAARLFLWSKSTFIQCQTSKIIPKRRNSVARRVRKFRSLRNDSAWRHPLSEIKAGCWISASLSRPIGGISNLRRHPMTAQVKKHDAAAIYTAFVAILLIAILLALWGEFVTT